MLLPTTTEPLPLTAAASLLPPPSDPKYSVTPFSHRKVVFGNRHYRHGKGTQHIERFNCTLRQRVSQLVRKTLSFSKELENHIAVIWLFIHHYNASLPL